MELWAGLGQAATVAQLVGVDAGGLITLITQAALTARQNKKACEQLSRRVYMIADLLPHLQQPELMRRPEFQRPLAGLGHTLREAHDLVMLCQRKSRFYRFLNARSLADKLRDIQSRIDSYLVLVPAISYIALTHNLNRIDSLRQNHTILPPPASTSSHSHAVPASAWEGVARFTLAEIAAASNSYAFFTKVGKGTSGTVYRGRLHDGRDVAIKRISKSARDREMVLRTELTVTPHPRHSHLVRLLGWCAEEDERLLVTEYMSNGSLHDHLHGRKPPSSPVTASWKTRVEVLLGASRAIKYLHHSFVPSVIHCNIKSSNILLNAGWTPRLSDLGFSVRHEAGVEEHHYQPQVVGKGGYMDPEYCRTGRLTPATDVYSFGVVMLEVLTGKPPIIATRGEEEQGEVQTDLVHFALPLIEAGELDKLLDGRPEPQPTALQIEALQWVANTAVVCLHRRSILRPRISDVVANLEIALRLASS
ncbi:putative serine/threonine-protein kinase-like protein CCR3 [Hordeum vulgare subsp. vulgare]|uniref:Protein kinase domain-containing protein n=1 Tax=Hordeum vulgare subsp. vulgare TaxID=112509 RepID=A0A8I6XUL0_HORVV|nr:putative serine/threonine-protein kinase-like protein CCR3 [Hordeum vulgare subsp. vulgare]